MECKRVLVLANSRKLGGRCVAGREIIDSRTGQPFSLGPWIRPVTSHEGGALDWEELWLNSGKQVQVMDFVEMKLAERAKDPCQPENWRIVSSQRWVDVSNRYVKPALSTLQESPRDLWRQPGVRSDRISHSLLHLDPPRQSLYLIRPTNLRIRLFRDDRNLGKTQAVFLYNGAEYDFPITDPLIHRSYDPQIPETTDDLLEIRLPCGDACYLCVSLTGEFHGNHYKLVATIIENVP
jgi:hypothetical protein